MAILDACSRKNAEIEAVNMDTDYLVYEGFLLFQSYLNTFEGYWMEQDRKKNEDKKKNPQGLNPLILQK